MTSLYLQARLRIKKQKAKQLKDLRKPNMEISFGKISQKVPIPNDVDELWSTIVCKIPGLTPHRGGLQMRYIDDEGDDICVTTTDELQEALRVGKETSNGFLSLNLSLPAMDQSTRTSIEEAFFATVPVEHCNDDESTDEEDYVEVNNVPPTPPPRTAANPTEPDVFQIMKNAGETAILGINEALNSAQTEINRMVNQLDTTNAQQKQTEADLASVKTELAAANTKFAESEQQVVKLTQDLDATKAFLAESTAQAQKASIRLKDLEKQALEKAVWQEKYKVAEQERAKLDQQLKTLRSALQALTTGNAPAPAKPVAAEVVSNEIIPSSPVDMEKGERLPPLDDSDDEAVQLPPLDCYDDEVEEVEPLPELPPAYAEPESRPVPSPTPLELQRQQQLQQLRDMGFHLTFEQLNEKLAEHSGNMEHVVHSLLSSPLDL